MKHYLKKKYSSGEGTRYISRNQALRKLQLTLKNFRKLCILKGIYPREPRNRKKAQRGDTSIKILYLKKDIQFLMLEPIIWKIRDLKIFARRMGKARDLRDGHAIKRLIQNRPYITLDHIVKERYPTFIDAIRDLDDCLTLVFLFSTFPNIRSIPRFHTELCRRLSIEFLHAVIALKALRKVFISIKGYYYQAEILGQTVTWIVPHQFPFKPEHQVDFVTMSTFVQFYGVLLGFVNFRLYHLLNLHYPPKLINVKVNPTDKTLVDKKIHVQERIAALNLSLYSGTSSGPTEEEELQTDEFPMAGDSEEIEEAKLEAQKLKKLKTLFKGLKFFLNREIPREQLVFVIKCFGGEVSWDRILFVGATFEESDETITHQIVDRPEITKQYISRYYIQPQWVFDSVNARELLPVENYFVGAVLPPHLSPFVDKKRQRYIPPEEKALDDPIYEQYLQREKQEEDDVDDEVEDDEEEEKDDDEENEEHESNSEDEQEKLDDNPESVEESETEKLRKEQKSKMAVCVGAVFREDPVEKIRIERQERKLREKMIQRKHQKLYRSMMQGREKRGKEVWLLDKKRRRLDEEEKQRKKEERKQNKLKQINVNKDV